MGKIIELSVDQNDDGIIRHAIRTIDRSKYWDANWDILEHFIAQCAVQFPHSFDYVARVVAWRRRLDRDLDTRLWADVARTVAAQGSALGRDSEVVWAIWLLKEINVKMPKSLADDIVANNSPIVLAFLAHARAHGLTTDKNLANKLVSTIDGDPYAGPHWPLTVELNHLGLAPSGLFPNLTSAPLGVLQSQGIGLIDWSAVPAVFEHEDSEDEGGDDELEYAIEDSTSDYEGTDWDGEDDDTIDWSDYM